MPAMALARTTSSWNFGAPILANTIAYAQRMGGDDRADKVGQIEFWFSDQSFGGVVPATPADATVPITNVENGTIMPYSMRGEYSGRFVAMRLTAHSTFGSIGGNEFRFVQGATELTLEVNRTIGSARIVNQGALAQVVGLKSYEIQSPAGSLVRADWTTLGQQDLVGFPTGNGTGNGWEAGGLANDSLLIESYLTGASAIGLNQSLSLGRIYDTVQSAADLRFRYVLADGVPRTGFVRYTDELPADFDADGDVDGGDFLRWQRNVGAIGAPAVSQGNADGDSDVDGADLAIWRDHFGFGHVLASCKRRPDSRTSVCRAGDKPSSLSFNLPPAPPAGGGWALWWFSRPRLECGDAKANRGLSAVAVPCMPCQYRQLDWGVGTYRLEERPWPYGPQTRRDRHLRGHRHLGPNLSRPGRVAVTAAPR